LSIDGIFADYKAQVAQLNAKLKAAAISEQAVLHELDRISDKLTDA